MRGQEAGTKTEIFGSETSWASLRGQNKVVKREEKKVGKELRGVLLLKREIYVICKYTGKL